MKEHPLRGHITSSSYYASTTREGYFNVEWWYWFVKIDGIITDSGYAKGSEGAQRAIDEAIDRRWKQYEPQPTSLGPEPER